MKKQRNYWKIATIVLAVIFLFIILIYSTPIIPSNKIYSVGSFQIPEKDFNALAKLNEDKPSFSICDITNNNCIKVTKIK